MTPTELLTAIDDLPQGIIADSRIPYVYEDRDTPAVALIEQAKAQWIAEAIAAMETDDGSE